MVVKGPSSLGNERNCPVEVERVVLPDPVKHFFKKLVDLFLGCVVFGLREVGELLMKLSVAPSSK